MRRPPFLEFRFETDDVFEHCDLPALKRLHYFRVLCRGHVVNDFIAQVFRLRLAILHQSLPSLRQEQEARRLRVAEEKRPSQ